MNRSEFQRLLDQETPVTSDRLPENFASEVLAKGKLVRRVLRQHWKWLLGASVVSLLLAVAFGLGATPLESDDPRPPLPLFQSNTGSAPFSSQ